MRTLRIILALGPFAISFFRDRMRWLWFGAPIIRTPAFHERRASTLVATIAGLGPAFVKLAQVFASRADLIPEPYLREFGTLIDRVPGVPYEKIEAVIAREYGNGATVHSLFERFDPVPVAAASLGQVHRAQYKGRDVAVKVLRPGIEKVIAADLAAARRIVGMVIKQWPHPHVIGLLGVIEEFSARIDEEMDFRLEAEFATEIRANFSKTKDVVIPEVVHEMTRQRVLVLDFIEGTRIDRLNPATVDVGRVVGLLVEIYVQMMLVDGLFHADPHPGNLMLTPDGRLVLLDFGMVVRVNLRVRRLLTRTVLAAVRKDPEAVAEGFMGLGLIVPGTDTETIRRLAELLIVNAFTKTTAQDRIDALLADRVMKTLYDFPIVLPRDLVYFARTAALIEGVGTRYDPYFQAIPIASPVVLRMRTKLLRSVGEDAKPNAAELATIAGYVAGKAARQVVDWWQSATGSPNRSKGMTRSQRTISKTLTVLMVGISAVASAQSTVATVIPPEAQQIAAAVQPLPKELRDGAAVLGYRTAGKLELLREGKNGMRCLALYVVRPDFHVACYYDGLEPFMSRGRELRAQGVTGAKVDTVRFAEIKSGKLPMPSHGALYSLTGKKGAFDPVTGKITGASQLSVVYMPGATGETTGISTVPVKDGPWMMFPGTPKAHIMIVGSMAP